MSSSLPLDINSGILYVTPLILGTAVVFKWWFRPKPFPGIPHHPIVSVWGDIPAMVKDTKMYGSVWEEASFFGRSVDELGALYQFLLGPFGKCVVLADAQEIEDVLLQSRSKSLESSIITRQAFAGTIPYGQISLPTNDMWRRHRRITMPLMTSKYLRGVTPRIATNAQLLAEFWAAKMEKTLQAGGMCFSCQNDFEYSSLDAITEIIAGRSLDAIPGAMHHLQTSPAAPLIDAHGGASFPHIPPLPLFTALRYLFSCITNTTEVPLFLVPVYQKVTSILPKFRQSYKEVQQYINTCVGERRQLYATARELGEEWENKCMIDIVMNQEGSATEGERLSGKELNDEVLTFLFAGHDTTSMALQWSMKFLTDAPDVQRKLREELLSALDDSPDKRPLTFDDVNSPDRTPYLEAVVAEVLRMGRVAEGFSRTTVEPMNVLGHTIPAGTDIVFQTGILGVKTVKGAADKIRALDRLRSDSSLKAGLGKPLWDDDAEEFKPERWLVDVDGRQQFDPKAGFSVPFGLGVRSCAGKQLALLELKVYLATLNLAFFLDKVPKALGTYEVIVQVTRSPRQVFIAPKPWNEL